MANEKTDIDNAIKAEKQIAGYAVSIPRQSEMIEKAFKDHDKPLQHIRDLIAGVGKDAKAYRGEVDDAAKALKAVRKWSSPGAAQAATKLESSHKSADKAVTGLERSVELFDKVWDGCWSAEKALREGLERTGAAAQKSSQELQGSLRSMQAHLDELQTQMARAPKAQPVAAMADAPPPSGSSPAVNAASKALRAVLGALAVTIKDCGPQITTATSVCSSIDTVLKKQDAAYHPDMVRLAADTRQLGQELARRVGAAQTLLKQALAGVTQGKALLASLG